MTKIMIRFILIVIFLGGPVVKAQTCAFPPEELFTGQTRRYEGFYDNKAYGYSVVIPDRLVGFDNASPGYQHGFGIAVGAEVRSYIVVDGDPNSLEYATAKDAAKKLLEFLRHDVKKVRSWAITNSTLGKLDAATLTATYVCRGSTERYVKRSVLALSPDKAMVYELSLYAHPARYERDRAVLDQLVKSWRLIERR